MKTYTSCSLCPRFCQVDRASGEKGFCGEGVALRIASASLHSGEEPPLTGGAGSGTIFVTGCNLGCRFCQNMQISRDGLGRVVTAAEFTEICRELERRGAANINIVTGSHAIPAIAEGLKTAQKAGVTLPVLWNSSAYETVETLALLDGGRPENRLVDIWLPDLKTQSRELARHYFAAPDYPETAAKAIRFMFDKAPLEWESTPFESTLKRGVIIRHLVLPGALDSTRDTLRWFAENARGRALLSLMTQYTPPAKTAPHPVEIPERYLSERENAAALAMLDEFGIDDGFIQDLAQDDEWLPDFAREDPFSSTLSVPVWHWKTGIVQPPAPASPESAPF
jgi:putative pyruvate formate lyase activating enzyme